MVHYVYMLECNNGRYYTGYTTDLSRRYQEHTKGSAKCKYTRSFPPNRLLASWKTEDGLRAAMQLESKIKQLSKPMKRQLASNPWKLSKLLELDYNYHVETGK